MLESGFLNQQIWVPVPALLLANIILGNVLGKISYLSMLRIHPPMVSECFLAVVEFIQKASCELHGMFVLKPYHLSIRFGTTLLRLEIRGIKC